MAAALVLLAITSYIKIEPFRQIVDAQCPWIKQQLAERGIRLKEAMVIQTIPAARPSPSPTPSPAATPSVQAASSAPVAPASSPATSSPIGDAPKNTAVDINQLAANRSLWPKTVKIKHATSFPAVVDGKRVGEINVPAGTEVKVVQVQPDKIGVAYSPDGKVANLGGAWLKTADTDLIERVQAGR